MQGPSSSVPSEPPTERSNQAPHIGVGRIAFQTSELTGEDVESLRQQGLSPIEQNEEGYTVFISDDSFAETLKDSEEEESEEADEEEEEEEDDQDKEGDEDDQDKEGDEEDGEESGSAFRGRLTPSENIDNWQERYVTGTSKLPGKEFIRCNLTVKTACDLSDPKQVKHLLKLDYLKLELRNCVNNEKHRGHFVHRIIVEVTPTEEWRTKMNHMYVMPSNDSQQKEYTDEKSRSAGGTVALTFPFSSGITGGYNTTQSRTVTSMGEYKWASAEVDDSPDRQRWSVTWTWNMLRWDDGQSFDPNKPWNVKGWSLPKVNGLPTLSLSAVEHNWAEWSMPSDVKEIGKMEWDVEVKFCTVSLKRQVLKLSTLSKNFYNSVRCGPEQIAPVKGKVSGVAPPKRPYAMLQFKFS